MLESYDTSLSHCYWSRNDGVQLADTVRMCLIWTQDQRTVRVDSSSEPRVMKYWISMDRFVLLLFKHILY